MERNTNQLTYVEVRLTHDSFPCEFTVDEIEPTVHLTLAVSAGLSIKAIYCYPSLLVCIHPPADFHILVLEPQPNQVILLMKITVIVTMNKFHIHVLGP